MGATINWVSVDDRQPDCFETVLIMCRYIGRPSVGYFDGEIWHIAEEGMTTKRKDIGCTHWAEMPEFK